MSNISNPNRHHILWTSQGCPEALRGMDGCGWMGDADAASSPVQFSGLKLFHTLKSDWVWSLGFKIFQWLADYFVKNVR